ncbi:type II toxin-antitoxin system VapB family antitoxin [Streptomyces meridianus]|uniref:Type II toxin-antitoxin system VapB family antitoxin n=1 Tax=Streptomyces meridianus TaxID=2938945 RepID=A0ABT0X3Y2_9ACTN|nr:type II toxin-antitoxin system VapB family antitoxin [Streptomyces meridianus]MCM2577238.1 type II toxin-antitoxin system VapB family antitoxin [Streptomyces meridianus]
MPGEADDALVQDAAEVLGTATIKATVHGVLTELVAAARRRHFVELLDEGALDDLADPDVPAEAWR